MRNFKEDIVNGIWEILRENIEQELSKESISVEAPRNRDFGDYTTNIALKIAKELHRKPMDVALYLRQELEIKCPWVEKITVVEPGFVNFFLGDQSLYEVLTRRASDDEGIFSRKDVPFHWQEKLQAFLEEDECRRNLKDMQYVHSRIHSILKLLREEGIRLEAVEEKQIVYEKSDLEKEVLRKLGAFSQQVEEALKHDHPEAILNYGMELGKLYFKLHEKTLFRQLEKPRLHGALRIMEVMGLIIRTILEAFEIEAPEKM